MLEIKGVTSPGEFAPCILTIEAQKLGTTNPPAALPATYQQLITGSLDAQYVEISGVVRQILPLPAGADTWRIILAADGGTIPVRIPLPQDPQVQVDAEVTVQAICFYQFNQRRQALNPVLQVPRGVSVTIKKSSPDDPYAAPVLASISLLQYSPEIPYGHRIHVRGVVTRSQSGSLAWIRDESSGLRIQTHQADELQPGDEIDALGFPSYGSSTPVLEDAIFKKIRSIAPPVPLAISSPTTAYDYQDDLISMEAMLTDVQPVLSGLVLTLKQNKNIFKAVLNLPLGLNKQPAWQVGSWVRVTGICDVTYDYSRPVMGVWQPQSFQILLRSKDDLTVIKSPPWWTAGHIAVLFGVFTGLLVVVSGAVTLVARRRLNEQARRRAMAEAEFTAILSERNRLAREIHDTLAQGLAATSVQLQLANIHTATDTNEAKKHIELAQQMVRDSLEEARNTIWNMRPQVLETGDLVNALKNILKQLSEGVVPKADFAVIGQERRLPAVVENNILRLGQEAITNAANHAQAKEIKVLLEYGKKYFSLTVTDDGQGFDPNNPPPSDGGFGLVGIQERAKELNGNLSIHSTPGQGTKISLTIPLMGA